MANRPLVCLSLIHPPQFQLFSQIHEILWRAFLPQMQTLSFAVEDIQNCPSSEPKQIVHQIRQVAGDEMIKMFNFIIQAKNLATGYTELLDILPDFEKSRPLVNEVCTSAFGGTRRTKEMQQVFIKIREALVSGIRRITVVLADGNQDALTGITQPVSKLFGAIDELNGLFQECRDYFEETEKQTSDETSIESNPPSTEETQMMREKWGRQIIQDGDVRYSPEAVRADTSRLSQQMHTMEGSKLSYLLNLTRPMDHSEGSTSGDRPAVIPPDPSPTKTKTPFWRKIFRYSKKVNMDGVDKHIDRDGTASAPSDSSPMHKPKIPFWRKLIPYLRNNNSERPTSESEAPAHPDAAAVASS